MTPLNDEQQAIIHELRQEIRGLNLEADALWAQYLRTGDEDCYNQVLAMDSEALMKGMVAYVPKVGERKISKIRDKLVRARSSQGLSFRTDPLLLNEKAMEARLRTLASINAWRDDLGLPPLERLPMGVPGDSHECTIARALHMTGVEAGWSDLTVQVSDYNSITMHGYHSATQSWMDSKPRFDASAATVIREFDQNRWLDLVEDLESHLRGRLEDGDYRVSAAELEGIHEELCRRGECIVLSQSMSLHHSVDVRLGQGTTPDFDALAAALDDED